MLLQATADYAAGINGHSIAFRRGEVVDLDQAAIVAVVRDAGHGVLDLDNPLTEAEAAEIRRQRAEQDAALHQATPRPAPPQRAADRAVSSYLVQQDYAADWCEYAPHGPLGRWNTTPKPPRRLAFTTGEVVELETRIAQWVNRDSPGTLDPYPVGGSE